jgi:hypothetical protein
MDCRRRAIPATEVQVRWTGVWRGDIDDTRRGYLERARALGRTL